MPDETIECEVTHPPRPAFADVEWGSENGINTASLCQACLEELWVKLNPLLQVNRVWVRIDKPGTLTRAKREV